MNSLHQIRVQAVRLERYGRRVKDEIWAGSQFSYLGGCNLARHFCWRAKKDVTLLEQAIKMRRITISMLVKCAERELGLRETVYPRRVAGKMSLQKAKHETECMRRIVEILKEMEAEHSRKLKLFA
jgi:hypothetical protein